MHYWLRGDGHPCIHVYSPSSFHQSVALYCFVPLKDMHISVLHKKCTKLLVPYLCQSMAPLLEVIQSMALCLNFIYFSSS